MFKKKTEQAVKEPSEFDIWFKENIHSEYGVYVCRRCVCAVAPWIVHIERMHPEVKIPDFIYEEMDPRPEEWTERAYARLIAKYN